MEYKTINGFSRYKASSKGDILSIMRYNLRPYSNNGYLFVSIYNDKGKRVSVSVHRLVATAWLGDIPKGLEVNHLDGNKSNNDVSNLQICTKSENQLYSFRELGRKGNRLNPARQLAIYTLHSQGWSQSKLAKAFNCTQSNISVILSTYQT